jgi:hypothetical protein
MEGLQRQIYNYSKGHVAYHLTTLIQDHDLRGALRIAVELPRWHVWRIKEWLLGRRSYPLSLTIREMFGNFVGPWALWRSRRRVKREGRSEPYLPVSQRQPDLHENLAGLGQYAEGGLPGRLHNWRNY